MAQVLLRSVLEISHLMETNTLPAPACSSNGGFVETSDYTVGSLAELACPEDHVFNNGLSRKIEKCSSRGRWSDSDWTCRG